VGATAAIGSACESVWRIFHLRGEPPMTAFAAHELATDHWFSIDSARRDLGYAPRTSMAAGLESYLPLLRADLGLPPW
jgi:nucleoside-diphosphate-sugar epimerase